MSIERLLYHQHYFYQNVTDDIAKQAIYEYVKSFFLKTANYYVDIIIQQPYEDVHKVFCRTACRLTKQQCEYLIAIRLFHSINLKMFICSSWHLLHKMTMAHQLDTL